MTINNHSENDWGFFVEMDYPSFDKIKRENDFKKIYWKSNQLTTIQEEEEENDNTICLSENKEKKTTFQLFHYSTATFVIICFVYFVFCVI